MPASLGRRSADRRERQKQILRSAFPIALSRDGAPSVLRSGGQGGEEGGALRGVGWLRCKSRSFAPLTPSLDATGPQACGTQDDKAEKGDPSDKRERGKSKSRSIAPLTPSRNASGPQRAALRMTRRRRGILQIREKEKKAKADPSRRSPHRVTRWGPKHAALRMTSRRRGFHR